MYADLGPGQMIDLEPPSPNGVDLLYSHEYVATRSRLRRPPPLSTAERTNLYAYVTNNPINRVDPSGLQLVAPPPVAPPPVFPPPTAAPPGLGTAIVVGVGLGVTLDYYVTGPLLGPVYRPIFDWWYDNPPLTDCKPRNKKDQWKCTTKARDWDVGTPCYDKIFVGTGGSEREAKDASEGACQAAGCHAPGRGGNCGHTTCIKLP